MVADFLGSKSGPLCSSLQFYFSNMSSPSAVSVAIWKPSSASTPQVGFMSCKASPTLAERFKSQGHRRSSLEVPCSGVPLGSLAGFWDGCRLWEINSIGSEIYKKKLRVFVSRSLWLMENQFQRFKLFKMFVFWQVKWLLEPSYDLLWQCDNVKSSGFVNLMTEGTVLELKSRSKGCQSGYQVLPPRRRWDFCERQLQALGRKDNNFRVVGESTWRCRAQEFLFGSLAGFWDGGRTLGDQL